MIFLNLCRHLVALQSGMTALERVAEMLNEPMGLTQELRLQQEAAAQRIAELESNLQAAYQEEQELRDDIEEEEARVAAEQEQALIVALEAKLRTAQLKQRDEQVRFVTSLNA